MSGRVYIKDPQRLGDFRAALGRFRERALQALRTTERGIGETQTWLDERRSHWEREVARYRGEVERASAALAACRSASRGRDDPPRDCSDQERELARARAQLVAAESALSTVKAYQRQLQEAAERYRRQANAMRQVVESQSKKAEAALADAQSELEAYKRVAVLSAFLGIGAALTFAKDKYQKTRNIVGSAAVRDARQQEIALVQATNKGTGVRTMRGHRPWNKRELKLLKNGIFPSNLAGHHINNVARWPDLARNPDNIIFATKKAHFKHFHRRNFHNNTSGKMFNRKSYMKQWMP